MESQSTKVAITATVKRVHITKSMKKIEQYVNTKSNKTDVRGNSGRA